MKREFWEGLGLEKETVDKIMAENGSDLEREKARTTAAKVPFGKARPRDLTLPFFFGEFFPGEKFPPLRSCYE